MGKRKDPVLECYKTGPVVLLIRWTLPPGVVDGIVPSKDDLGDGDKGVSLLQQALNNAGQGLRGVLGGVVEQDNGAGADLGGDPLGDVRRGQIFPVQTVPTGSGWNRLGRKGLRIQKQVDFSVG